MIHRHRLHAAEPDVLVGIVFVRDDKRDLHAAREQHLQAAHADVVIREHDCTGLRAWLGRRTHSDLIADRPRGESRLPLPYEAWYVPQRRRVLPGWSAPHNVP